jgi:uncharacterized protein with FMN-binding domain
MTTTRRTGTPSTVRPAEIPGLPLHRRVLTALAAVSILGAAGCAGSETEAPAAEAPVEETSAAAPATSAAPDAGTTGGAAAATTYADGEYTQTGAYQSPAGEEEVGVTLTLEADVVTAVTVEPMPDNPTTEQYQGRFAGGISDAIVGQKLDDLAVDKVAGSSLTSGGFNDAVGKIKSEAQA